MFQSIFVQTDWNCSGQKTKDGRSSQKRSLVRYRLFEPMLILKSIHVHLAPQIFSFVQFQNFKHQQLAYFLIIFWYLFQSSTPYQSEDRCMSHKHSIERAINRTECRRAIFRNRSPSCLHKTKLYWLKNNINLLRYFTWTLEF